MEKHFPVFQELSAPGLGGELCAAKRTCVARQRWEKGQTLGNELLTGNKPSFNREEQLRKGGVK